MLSGIVVTNDGNSILRELDLAHPAAKVWCVYPSLWKGYGHGCLCSLVLHFLSCGVSSLVLFFKSLLTFQCMLIYFM